MEKVTKEMREALRMPLPVGAVTKHPTKTFLSSIKAIYVTERLNDVFGVGSWQIKVNHVTTTEKSMVVVKVEFSIPEYGIYFECYGGNDNGGENSKNFDLGDAYKGATTDALTKIGSYLEIGIDVFKGLNTAPAPQQQFKKWLNITDSNGSDTKEWLNVITAINEKKITSIAEVKKYYNLSKEVEQKINELWK
ncbi:MAG TPA: Rad52/Rad22 family DNA repair protein [Chitinophagales bacterium]|nr:Rad52/Rad22 family DNA repair protein [Chitinophagales bacterium]